MEKVFFSDHFGRTVTISISFRDVDFIFSFPGEDFSFYDFPKIDWNDKYKKHMATKAWFTQGMYDFITSNILP